ncbi:1-deoxy-D-xylulose-5-phosphate reductoisomerase [Comamonas sp.]|uniref:1-deoxy-D-xylulose-5-phosphate reductoisomerase n=1 Tax=Comamonas sp. TaxID=34028 RepID=UPI00289A19DA|nr:1-deoxy-D-xylulose-5-phosphate reductoisomerase [Comamonas sp.]
MTMQVTVLGSTGSIGTNTLDVVARHPDLYRVFALSAHSRVDLMLAQCLQFQPRYAVMTSATAASALREGLRAAGSRVDVLEGEAALEMVASHSDVHAVMAAIVGAAGLRPAMAAAKAGKRLMLANKEALVVGGQLFMDAVADGGATLLPIDSEHSAIFQCLPEDPAVWPQRVDHIILTASGGPFRTREPSSLRDVTPQQAGNHPNFAMGRKISIDSATMMNKALEVIEARWLFNLQPEQIQVVIHPQQIVHSMVQFRDASVLAQLGTPDMRVPIACGLAWPERVASGAAPLDFAKLSALTFEEADARRFPGLHLSWQALRAAEGTTTVLNAANEVAAAAFLDGRMRFDQIYQINAQALDGVLPQAPGSIDALLALDAEVRCYAEARIAELAV